MNILQAIVAATKAARATGTDHIVATSSTCGGYRILRADHTFALAPFDAIRYTCYSNGDRYRH